MWEPGHCTGPVNQPRGPDIQHGNGLTPIHQLSSENNAKFLLALELLYLCCSPWGSWDMPVEDFILRLLPLLAHLLTPF